MRDERSHDPSFSSPSGSFLHKLLEALEAKEAIALVTVVAAEGDWSRSLGQHLLVWLDRPPYGSLDLGVHQSTLLDHVRGTLISNRHRLLNYTWPEGTVELFVEVQRRPPHLVIVGAGHVAAPLAQLGKLADFQVTVLDDRPQYANRERFPTVDRVIAAPLMEVLRQLPLDKDSYIVLVTRGHQQDVTCLLEILDRPLAYIGMIGSKRRVRAVFQLLSQEQGIPAQKFERVHAPIGLPIGAETPAEIAIAIMAEIVNVYRGGSAKSLSGI